MGKGVQKAVDNINDIIAPGIKVSIVCFPSAITHFL